MKKKIKDGSLYFRQKDIARPLGAALLVVGLVWFYIGYSMASYYIPCIIVPLGLVLFLVGGSRLISENDMAERLGAVMLDYDKSVTDLPAYDRVILRAPAPVEIKAYHFGGKATYFKKGKNSTPVSDICTTTHFFFAKEAVMIVGRTVSTAALGTGEAGDDSRAVTDFSTTLAYAEIASAAIEEHSDSVKLTNTGKMLSVKWCELVLIAADEAGTELLRVPAKNDMDAAGLCEEINRRARENRG